MIRPLRTYALALVLGLITALTALAILDGLADGVYSERFAIMTYTYFVVAVVVGTPVFFLWSRVFQSPAMYFALGALVGIAAGGQLVASVSAAPFWDGYWHPDAQKFVLSLLCGGLALGWSLARSVTRAANAAASDAP